MSHRISHFSVFTRALLATPPIQAAALAATPPGLPEPGTPDAAGLDAANAAIGPAFKAQRWDGALDLGQRAYAAGGGADALETIAVTALRLGHANLAFSAYGAIAADPAAPPRSSALKISSRR
jgi:hypothetical protein